MRTVTALSATALCVLALSADARSKSVARFDEFQSVNPGLPFQLLDPALGETKAPVAKGMPSSLRGSTIAAISGGALVIDGDSGKLLRTDADGSVVAELAIGREASQLVVDAKRERAYVADREHDRVVVVSLAGAALEQVDSLRTAAEPFGLALSPDGSTLLVTQIADKKLTAIDTASGDAEWSLELGPEPRGVAISPDGTEAMVTFLTTGSVAKIALARGGAAPKMTFVSLDPPPAANQPQINHFAQQALVPATSTPRAPGKIAPIDPDAGKTFVRNAFSAAYVGHGLAVVPHQLSTPHIASEGFEVESSGYGGGNGFTAPVNHRIAFLDASESAGGNTRMAMASTSLHQPRAMAYDGSSDTLYVAGYGSDDVMAIADVSQSSVHLGWQHTVVDGANGCAPDGLAVDDASGNVLVYCSLTRKIVRLAGNPDAATAPVATFSKEIAKTRLTAAETRGKKLFRQGRSAMISTGGAMSCSNCHAEGRSDGLTWFLQGNTLQTPFLNGRLEGTHPYKWDGQDANLNVSLTSTVKRLGGSGITQSDARDLQAFLTELPRPRTPTVEDPQAVARGKQLFESNVTGCLNCHDGQMSSDGKSHDLAVDLPSVDTPSLIGLAQSAPYYHDGSATTLEAVLRNNGSVHAMGRTSRLEDPEISDLVAYLETL
ncbi:MAG: c-type cytochrome [Deltaproteobacteria bacterium]|nr:c-type cytochrome [Nannocystaceae bacterium]